MPASTRRPAHAARKATQERSIDKMVEESFPASDATQLPGRAAGAPTTGKTTHVPESEETPHEFVPGTPRTIGNQGVAPASRMLGETVQLADVGSVTVRFDSELRRLLLYFSEDGMGLDAAALDRLIAVLSSKRALLGD